MKTEPNPKAKAQLQPEPELELEPEPEPEPEEETGRQPAAAHTTPLRGGGGPAVARLDEEPPTWSDMSDDDEIWGSPRVGGQEAAEGPECQELAPLPRLLFTAEPAPEPCGALLAQLAARGRSLDLRQMDAATALRTAKREHARASAKRAEAADAAQIAEGLLRELQAQAETVETCVGLLLLIPCTPLPLMLAPCICLGTDAGTSRSKPSGPRWRRLASRGSGGRPRSRARAAWWAGARRRWCESRCRRESSG
jgi:hypothetical protein